jgi:hypothetical protein
MGGSPASKAGVDLPSFGLVNDTLGAGLGSSESAMANRYNQLGLGGSTMQGQDAQAIGNEFNTQSTIDMNQVAQQQFQDQVAAAGQQGSGGFLSGLVSGGAGAGALGL